jgi:uncharacterized protein YqgC (DUF456 family)
MTEFAPAVLMAVGVLLVAAGFAGLLLPALPGAPLMFLGLVVIAWAEDFTYVGAVTLGVLAALALLTYAIDVLAGLLGAKRFGASPRAMFGAGVGAVVGIFFGLPGVVLGPLIGAFIGQLSSVPDLVAAGRAGVGAALGLVLGVALKIAVAFTMVGIFLLARFT